MRKNPRTLAMAPRVFLFKSIHHRGAEVVELRIFLNENRVPPAYFPSPRSRNRNFRTHLLTVKLSCARPLNGNHRGLLLHYCQLMTGNCRLVTICSARAAEWRCRCRRSSGSRGCCRRAGRWARPSIRRRRRRAARLNRSSSARRR